MKIESSNPNGNVSDWIGSNQTQLHVILIFWLDDFSLLKNNMPTPLIRSVSVIRRKINQMSLI